LTGQPALFLDVCSSIDLYSDKLWKEATEYFENMDSERVFPGGRYACARFLEMCKLPFLQDYSLGQICHIVQLAITQRRLLGYRAGHLVAFKQSEICVKEQCALTQSPSSQEEGPVASWDSARLCLQQLLTSNAISISNVKRLFCLHFGMELSETALGHVRLLDLLKDSRLNGVCSLHVEQNGQVMVKGIEPHFHKSGPAPMTPPGMWSPCTPVFVPFGTVLPQSPCVFNGSSLTGELLSPCASPRGCSSQSSISGFSLSPESSPRGVHAELHCKDERHWETRSSGSTELESCAFGHQSDSEDSEPSTSCQEASWTWCVKNTFIDLPVQHQGSRQRRLSLPARIMVEC